MQLEHRGEHSDTVPFALQETLKKSFQHFISPDAHLYFEEKNFLFLFCFVYKSWVQADEHALTHTS